MSKHRSIETRSLFASHRIRTHVQITKGAVLTSVHVMIVTAHTRDAVHVGLSLDLNADVRGKGFPVFPYKYSAQTAARMFAERAQPRPGREGLSRGLVARTRTALRAPRLHALRTRTRHHAAAHAHSTSRMPADFARVKTRARFPWIYKYT